MNIQEGQLYVNKTWRFLVPCLKYYGDTFIAKFNPVFKLAFGLYDASFDLSKGRNIYILCDTRYNSTAFQSFFNFIKQQDYFVKEYYPETNLIRSNRVMIVIKIPDMFKNAYDSFQKSQYSKMYNKSEINSLFLSPSKTREYQILTKDRTYIKDFIRQINLEFNTELTENDFDEDIKEFELPLKGKEEIFNYEQIKTNIYVKQE